MLENNNMALWKLVEKTPEKHTKPITGKQYKGTSPKPHYIVMKATEIFGPCGIGWGFNVVSERIEEGEDGKKVSLAHVRVWYKWNGERGEVEHVGGTEFSGKRGNGNPFTDEDAPKKSITDALIKAMSMIGFAGDIFMGRYDDSKYVDALKEEEKQANKPPEKTPEEKAEAFRDGFLKVLATKETSDAVKAMVKKNQAKIDEVMNVSKEINAQIMDAIDDKLEALAMKDA